MRKSVSQAGRQPAAPTFKPDVPVERRRYTDQEQFVITALWLAGFSASAIARTFGYRRGQILGIVHRSGFDMRSTMSDSLRQAELDFLRDGNVDPGTGERLDRGLLSAFDWKILPLEDGRKRRPGRKAVAF